MQRACDLCGTLYEAKRATSRFHEPKCRVAWAKGKRPTAQPSTPSAPRASTAPVLDGVADRVTQELTRLGVVDHTEAGIVIGIAKQLDSNAIIGAAYVSLSKEFDRRLDALRLKAERVDDPARVVKDRLEAKRLRLA